MAFRMRHWIGLVTLSCAAVAVGYLPPNTAVPTRDYGFVNPNNEARAAQGRLTRQIRSLRARREILELRDKLLAQIATTTGGPGAPAVFAGDGISEILRDDAQRTLQGEWNALGRHANVDVVLYLRLASEPSEDVLAPRPQNRLEATTLLPEATDGRTCIRVVTMSRFHRIHVITAGFNREVEEDLSDWGVKLGLCGFYAAFGKPGPAVAQWLSQAGYRFGLEANWVDEPASSHMSNIMQQELRGQGWYHASPNALACASGKTAACAPIILGTGGRRTSFTPSGVGAGWVVERTAGAMGTHLLGWHLDGAEAYVLSNLVRQAGPERFERFWKTTQPFDSAFVGLTGEHPEVWTRAWVQDELGIVRAGPSISLGFASIATLVCAASIVGGIYFAMRRTYGPA